MNPGRGRLRRAPGDPSPEAAAARRRSVRLPGRRRGGSARELRRRLSAQSDSRRSWGCSGRWRLHHCRFHPRRKCGSPRGAAWTGGPRARSMESDVVSGWGLADKGKRGGLWRDRKGWGWEARGDKWLLPATPASRWGSLVAGGRCGPGDEAKVAAEEGARGAYALWETLVWRS